MQLLSGKIPDIFEKPFKNLYKQLSGIDRYLALLCSAFLFGWAQKRAVLYRLQWPEAEFDILCSLFDYNQSQEKCLYVKRVRQYFSTEK